MSGSAGADAFQLAFQISPIVFTGGIAANIPGGVLPIGLVTASQALVGGLLSGGGAPSLDQIFPKFQPLPGGSLIDFQIGKYPFANQNVAANATIAQPLTISMHMYWPATPGTGGFLAKTFGIMAMQSAMQAHGTSGGTYTVITPSYFYTNLILTRMSDISSGQSKQVQTDWQLDFEQPLLTLNAAQSVLSPLMQKLNSGLPTSDPPAWSGLENSVGNPNSLAAPAIAPLAGGSPSGSTSPFLSSPALFSPANPPLGAGA